MQPHKKPRLMPVGVPDGFGKSPAQSKAKIVAPQFTSAFAQSSSVAPKPRSTIKAPHSSLDPHLRDVGSASSSSEHAKFTVRKAPPAADLLVAEARPIVRPNPAASRPDPFIAFKDVLRDKRPLQQDDLFAPSLKKHQVPELAYALLENERDKEKLVKRVSSPPKLPPGSHTKHLFTLSTIGIARATDISTDNGNAELASIFLDDQHPEILQGEENNGEMWRGLNFSPQKKRYGHHGPQFVRNGLASRASQVLGRMQTSLTLWQREMERQLTPDTYSGLNSDLRLTIVKIEQMPAPTFTKSNATSFGIALCRIHAPSNRANLSFTTSYRKLLKVIFSFPLPAPQSPVRSATRFAVGAEVFTWKPWHEVKLARAAHPVSEAESGSDSAARQQDIADTLLLCNRFLFAEFLQR
ncbi:hypothetical protein AX15_007770 [Amanita polypyramis BW_CC]|nr:hypothetical protein AX15_007770 [Amanita polypyramis BW_CC]